MTNEKVSDSITLTFDTEHFNNVIGASLDYSNDTKDTELCGWLAEFGKMARDTAVPMDFVVVLKREGDAVGHADWEDDIFLTNALKLSSSDEFSAFRNMMDWSSSKCFKVAFVEGVCGDYAVYVAPAHWDDLRVRSGGSKMPLGSALVAGDFLTRLKKHAGEDYKADVPAPKLGLTYRSP